MSANIETFEDGSAAFASAREIAWHKLGTVTSGAMTAEEALELAQLDWKVKVSESPVGALVNGVVIPVKDKFATYRDHPKMGIQGLGVVGNRYVPIQNSDAFSFLNNLVDESGAIFETAGSLSGGRQVFMSIKMPESIQLNGGADSVDMYLMATTSHDGSKSFTAAVTPIRPVCTNTVALALDRAKSRFNLRHTIGAQGKVAQAKEVLGLVHKYEAEFQLEVERLLDASYTNSQFEQLVETLFPIDDEATQVLTTKRTNQRDALLNLWTAPTQTIVGNTKWAAYNAVAEYADWFSPIRGVDPEKNRARRIVTGELDTLKNKALTLLR